MSIKEIHESSPKYTCYEYSNFYRNVGRILKKLDITLPKNKTHKSNKKSKNKKSTDKQPEGKKKNSEKKKKTKGWRGSEAKDVLLKLLLDKKSLIQKKTDDEIYNSHACFQEFDEKYFKKKVKDVRKSAARINEVIDEQEMEFQKDQLAWPRNAMTIRGYPFWDTHRASVLLEQDVKDGLDSLYEPSELRALREEYQDFPLEVFRKHIYQERRKQKEGVYWIPTRNRKAQKRRDEEVQKMKEEWENVEFDAQVDGICKQWKQLNFS